jgi:hypothetical protein
MKLGRVADGDSLFRHCVFPIAVNKKGIIHEKMWNLTPMEDGALHGSLAWERYVPTVDFVHGYGCRLSFGRNEKKRKAGTFEEKKRQYYCGAYRLMGHAVRALAITQELDEIASADIVHQIEGEEIAHADLRIFLKPGVDVEGTKTAIVDRLWHACLGPLRHICDCDEDVPTHLSSNLQTAPAGDYYDFRPWIFRSWHLVRFRVFRWLWLNSTPPAITSKRSRSFASWQWLRIRFRICDWLWRIASQN